jgi:hypothetical protein
MEQFARISGIGWVWLRAKDVTRPWERCPYCWGKLPQIEGVVDRASKYGWDPTKKGEPWSSEDGG